MPQNMHLGLLKKGQKAVVESIEGEALENYLMRVGLVPGDLLELVAEAPFGDPLAVKVNGVKVAMRRHDAEKVAIQLTEA